LIKNIHLNGLFEDISWQKSFFLKIFWAGFIIYIFGFVGRGMPPISMRMGELLELGGLAMVVAATIFLFQSRIKNSYLLLLVISYFIWLVFIIIRGFHFDFTFIMYMILMANTGMLYYFMPIILFFPKNLQFYKSLFDIIIIFAILNMLFTGLFRHELLERSPYTKDTIELLAWSLSMPCGFLLLNYKYQSPFNLFFAAGTLVTSLLFAIYNGRRGLSMILAVMLIAAFLIFLFHTKAKVFTIYLTVLFICIGSLYATSIYNIGNNKLFNFIAERGDTDTRTGVEVYFYNDMGTKDWIIGRGLDGKYYCPGIDDDIDYRTLIETGFLQIILKGGLIRLVIMGLIMIPAIFLGLFSSRNILSKASAIWIMIFIFSLYPAMVESFNLMYMLVWIAVDICYSKKLRDIPDNALLAYFYPKKFKGESIN
jgi:hypothetical protein